MNVAPIMPFPAFHYAALSAAAARRQFGMAYVFERRSGVHRGHVAQARSWLRQNFGSTLRASPLSQRWEVHPFTRRIYIRHEADAMLFRLFWT